MQRDDARGVTGTCSAHTAPGWTVPAPGEAEQRGLFKAAFRTGSPHAAAGRSWCCLSAEGTGLFGALPHLCGGRLT